MVTEKLDTCVHGMYINESEVCKNEENVQISQVLCQTHPHSNLQFMHGCDCFPAQRLHTRPVCRASHMGN